MIPVDPPSGLGLPSLEDIEQALALEGPDRAEIPGLYALNAERVPMLRLIGLQAVLAFAALHNTFMGVGPEWRVFLAVTLAVELYAVGSLLVLRRFFASFRRLHLGTVFVGLDLGVFTLIVWATGGARSWMWPLYLVRVADQMWIGRRRAAIMAVLGVFCYGGLLLGGSLSTGFEAATAVDLFKVASLAAFAAYMIAASGLPWNLQKRTPAARQVIVRLEAQAREISRQRARAEHASLAKSHFLARMSHELRTPLNSVVGFTNVLIKKQGANLPPRERDYLARIRENGMHLLALINDVLDIARIEEGELETHIAPIDLEHLVRDTLHQMEGRMVESKVRLSVSFPKSLTPLAADETRLRQVLINLIGNAIKFTREGWIRVEVHADPRDGTPASLSVADSGVGIEASRIHTIFDAFEQGESGYARKFSGTGLGLAISRSLCDLMSFDLSVASTEGEGSTFTVRFRPITDPEPVS